jgi:hypothetical protein
MKKDFNFSITIKLNRSDVLKALKSKGANTEYLEEIAMWMREGAEQKVGLDADVPEDAWYIDMIADLIADFYELTTVQDNGDGKRVVQNRNRLAKHIGNLEDLICYLKQNAEKRTKEQNHR